MRYEQAALEQRLDAARHAPEWESEHFTSGGYTNFTMLTMMLAAAIFCGSAFLVWLRSRTIS